MFHRIARPTDRRTLSKYKCVFKTRRPWRVLVVTKKYGINGLLVRVPESNYEFTLWDGSPFPNLFFQSSHPSFNRSPLLLQPPLHGGQYLFRLSTQTYQTSLYCAFVLYKCMMLFLLCRFPRADQHALVAAVSHLCLMTILYSVCGRQHR